MRLALVSQEYPPETAHGGIGTQTYLKAHGLASLGHEVHVISHSTDNEKHEYDDGQVHVVRIPGFDERLPIQTELVRWLTYSAAVAGAIAELHSRLPLDLLDFPEWGCEAYVHLLNRAEWNHIPTVIQLHGPLVMFAQAVGWPDVQSDLYRVGTAMEATCLQLADSVFSSSRCSAEWCANHYGLDRQEIPVLHTGVDTCLFCRQDVTKEDRPTVLSVGSVERNKGVEFLLAACLRLAKEHPGLQLRIIGRGNELLIEELKLKAQSAGFGELLDLQGYVDRRELPRHFSRAHVFASPSLYEGGPSFVCLEAMACELPVIASDGSGTAEVVTSEQNGLLVPPGDIDALETALRRLISDKTLRREIGARGREYVLREADSTTCLRRLERYYKSVVAPFAGRAQG